MLSFEPTFSLSSLTFIKTIESVMPSNHLIICYPLLLLPSVFPRIRVFSNVFFSSLPVTSPPGPTADPKAAAFEFDPLIAPPPRWPPPPQRRNYGERGRGRAGTWRRGRGGRGLRASSLAPPAPTLPLKPRLQHWSSQVGRHVSTPDSPLGPRSHPKHLIYISYSQMTF